MAARTAPAKAPSGRADKRRRAILDAARDLFLEKGYVATTLVDVVARSGGSLATIYELFGNKRGLFEIVLLEHANPVIESITLADGPRDPEARLTLIARRYLEKVLDPRIVAWWRTMMAEAAYTPELRDIFLSKEGGAVVQLARPLSPRANEGRFAAHRRRGTRRRAVLRIGARRPPSPGTGGRHDAAQRRRDRRPSSRRRPRLSPWLRP